MGAVITVHMPFRKDDIPIDIVAVKTKRHSWSVDLKHSGRFPRVGASSTKGGDDTVRASAGAIADERW
jgi:hypothetical protein